MKGFSQLYFKMNIKLSYLNYVCIYNRIMHGFNTIEKRSGRIYVYDSIRRKIKNINKTFLVFSYTKI